MLARWRISAKSGFFREERKIHEKKEKRQRRRRKERKGSKLAPLALCWDFPAEKLGWNVQDGDVQPDGCTQDIRGGRTFFTFYQYFFSRELVRTFFSLSCNTCCYHSDGKFGSDNFFLENIFPIFHLVFAMDRSLLGFFLLKPSPPQSLMWSTPSPCMVSKSVFYTNLTFVFVFFLSFFFFFYIQGAEIVSWKIFLPLNSVAQAGIILL